MGVDFFAPHQYSVAPPRPSQTLWNPIEILGIRNTDAGYGFINCVGFAPSQGRRCRNPINASNISFIMRTLNDIALLPPNSHTVLQKLRAVVNPALCVRYHQEQAEEVLANWRRKIQQLPRVERLPIKHSYGDKRQGFSEKQQSMAELMEVLRQMQQGRAFQEWSGQTDGRKGGVPRKSRDEGCATSNVKTEPSLKSRKTNKQELEQTDNERLEKIRLASEKAGKDLREKEVREKARSEREKKEKEKAARKAAEKVASNERIRQRAQKSREAIENAKISQEMKERAEWNALWTKYQANWVEFRAAKSQDGDIKNLIPWPVKSGSYKDVSASNVQEFFKKAVPSDVNRAKLMRRECLNWHPDKMHLLPGGERLEGTERILADVCCRVVTGLLNDS